MSDEKRLDLLTSAELSALVARRTIAGSGEPAQTPKPNCVVLAEDTDFRALAIKLLEACGYIVVMENTDAVSLN